MEITYALTFDAWREKRPKRNTLNMKILIALAVLALTTNFATSAFAALPGDNFLRVMSEWSGVSSDQIKTVGLDQSIYSLYVQGHNGNTKITTTVLEAFQSDDFYKSCPASMSSGEFVCQQSHGYRVGSFYYPVTGTKYSDDGCGDLTTLRQLYVRLSNCQ